jgi:hypothetical protein
MGKSGGFAGTRFGAAANQSRQRARKLPWRLFNLHRFAPYSADVARRAVAKLSYRTRRETRNRKPLELSVTGPPLPR